MKIANESSNVESEGTANELTFGADNLGFVFEILRSKLYSNPIKAICREVTCNARDAHREVGKGDLPIEIDLPNALSSELRIRDFGPGISPDRMTNVFLQYGASTKRNSNDQTGGFGIGAKTPFAYSDSFSIITTVKGTTYNYTAFIDETQVGKIALMSKKRTRKPSGTEIVIAIKPADFETFIREILIATFWWAPRPIINIGPDVYERPETKMTDLKSTIPGIEVYVDNSRSRRAYWEVKEPKSHDSFGDAAILILIDRMPYAFDDKKVFNEIHYAYRDELMHTVYSKEKRNNYYPGGDQFGYGGYIGGDMGDRFLHRPPIFMMYPPKYLFNFNNGELNVSINREKFSVTTELIAALRNKIRVATECYMNSINSKDMKEFQMDRYY